MGKNILHARIMGDFLPGVQSLPVKTVKSLVAVFPKDRREDASKALLLAVNEFHAWDLAREKAKKPKNAKGKPIDLHKMAKALEAAADAISDLVYCRAVSAGLAECAAGGEADVPETQEAWGEYQSRVNHYKALQGRVHKYRGDLWEMAAVLRNTAKPGGHPGKPAIKVFASRLRDVYNAHSGKVAVSCFVAGTGRLVSSGSIVEYLSKDYKKKESYTPRNASDMGEFVLSVFNVVGISMDGKGSYFPYTAEALESLVN